MATNSVSPKKGKVVDIPDAVVTIGTPTAGDASVSVAFTASSPATGGPVQKYTAVSSPGSVTVSGSTSPINVTGLTNSTAYTFTVAAGNATGNGVFSSASASATPFLASSYDSIATQSVVSATAYVDFTSIPSTYKHLQLRMMGFTTNNFGAQFNSDTSAAYTYHRIDGDGSTATSSGASSTGRTLATFGAGNTTTSYPAVAVVDILDYTSTNKTKTVRTLAGHDNNGSGEVMLYSNLWTATPATISSIRILIENGSNIGAGSTFALYGIKG